MAPLIFQLTSDALAPLQLATDPIGWDGLKYLWERSLKYHGVAFSVSSELTFVKAAAAYLRTVYEGGTDSTGRAIAARGVEGLVTLTVFEQNPNELQPEEIYRGRVDFTTYASSEAGVSVSCKETGFTTALLTRTGTAVDLLGNQSLTGLALPAYAPTLATLHSRQTLQRFELRRTTADNAPQPGIISDLILNTKGDPENSLLFFFGMDAEPLINELGIAPFATGPESGDSYSPINLPFYTATAAGTHTIELRLNTTVHLYHSVAGKFEKVNIKYHFRKNGDPATATDLIPPLGQSAPFAEQPSGIAYINQYYELNTGVHTFVEPMVAGDRLYLYGEVYLHQWTASSYTMQVTCAMGVGSYLKVSAPTTTPATTCPGLLVHEAFTRICEAATDTRDAFYSDYFGRTDTRRPYLANGPGALRLLTSGFQLRGFPLPASPAPATGEIDPRKSLALSFDDLYAGCDATDCLGMGIEARNGRPVVRVEPRGYFYQPTETLRLGRVTDLKKRVYPDGLYNEAAVGYAHWQSGAANGLDEFNGRRTYALPLTQSRKIYTAISPLNAAGYLIEEARRERFIAGATKEGRADAEPFVICLRPTATGYVSEQREAFVGPIAGILSPDTAYNLRLSPGRMLRAHAPYLRAGLAAQAGKRLLLGAVEGNAHLLSQLLTEPAPLDEFTSPALADLPAAVWLAETYEFTARVRRGQMRELRRAPYGLVSFLDSAGTRKSGYLLRAERTPQGGRTAFTLLRAAL